MIERLRIDRDGNAPVAPAARGDLDRGDDRAQADHRLALVEPHRHDALAAGWKLLHFLEREDEEAPLARERRDLLRVGRNQGRLQQRFALVERDELLARALARDEILDAR